MSEKIPELEGRWEMIRGTLGREEAPELVARKTEVEFTAGVYVVRFEGEIVDRGSYKVGATLEMNTIILHGEEGPNAGRTIPCIYQLVGDRLRVCYGLNGVAPSASLTATTDDHFLAIYRRTMKPQ